MVNVPQHSRVTRRSIRRKKLKISFEWSQDRIDFDYKTLDFSEGNLRTQRYLIPVVASLQPKNKRRPEKSDDRKYVSVLKVAFMASASDERKEEMEHGHFLGVIGTTLFILEGVNRVICLAHNQDF